LTVTSAEEFRDRFAYDLLFYIIITVILLNILFGVIIDKFGELREEAQRQQEFIASRCFVCGLPSQLIDSAARQRGVPGFKHHIEHEHSAENYMHFIFLLYSKHETEYTGPEQRVKSMLEDEDVTWMPINRSIITEGMDDTDESAMIKLFKKFDQLSHEQHTFRQKVEAELIGLSSYMEIVFEHLEGIQKLITERVFVAEPDSGDEASSPLQQKQHSRSNLSIFRKAKTRVDGAPGRSGSALGTPGRSSSVMWTSAPHSK
jgi:hypothetical protein